MGVPVEGCWFCLGSSSVDISLVASVGNEAYVTVDKVGYRGFVDRAFAEATAVSQLNCCEYEQLVYT
jgi:hypothetical protein